MDPSVADLAKQLAETQKQLADTRTGVNFAWTLVGGFLVMFMQTGFALLETGLCRAKNAAHTMAMNFVIYGIGGLVVPLALLAVWLRRRTPQTKASAALDAPTATMPAHATHGL